jgi:hypothetical protein
MIKRKKPQHPFDSAKEKLELREKLLPNDETTFYAPYDLKRSQALTA